MLQKYLNPNYCSCVGTEGAQTGSVSLWFMLQWQGRKAAFAHPALPWAALVTLSKPDLFPQKKENCRYFFSFP